MLKFEESKETISAKERRKYENTQIATVPWKKLRRLVMNDEINYTQIKIPLTEHQ